MNASMVRETWPGDSRPLSESGMVLACMSNFTCRRTKDEKFAENLSYMVIVLVQDGKL